MIPEEIIYRIYGDSLGIILNLRTNRVVLLQKEPLQLWNKIINGHNKDLSRSEISILNQLICLKVIKINSHHNSSIECNENTNENIQDVNFGAVNYWAFKNIIPISGHFELTGRCNLRCKHCYCLFENNKDILSTENVFGILDELHKNGTFGLVLTGGEVFMRKDIIDILDYMFRKKFAIRINTNGTLIDESIVEKMKPFTNIYRIHLSLYGSSSEIHDRITNVPGSFNKSMHALNLLKKAGFNLRINCSVMKSNYDTYKTIQSEIGDKIGIPVHYDSIIFPKDDGSIENLDEQLEELQNDEFMQFKHQLMQNTNTPKIQTSLKKPKLCKAAFSFFSICEDGNVYPCLKMKRFYSHSLGNLSEVSFSKIWHNSESMKIRQSLVDKLRNCKVCDLEV